MGSEIKVPGDLEKTFAEDEKASIIVEPSRLKPKMHPKKSIVTNKTKKKPFWKQTPCAGGALRMHPG